MGDDYLYICAICPNFAARKRHIAMTKEQEILQAAEEEFLRVGYDACSTAVIATKAGVTHAMVNYYFRTKEKLFLRILDDHVLELLKNLKPLMSVDGKFVRVVIDAAEALFDTLAAEPRLPLLISDIARTHPQFLLRYGDTLSTICKDSVNMHVTRLQQHIAQGSVAPCTMTDIYSTVLTLVLMPFLSLPILENVATFDEQQRTAFLQGRREEMARILQARYGTDN